MTASKPPHERASVPKRHPATIKAWEWLQSRTVQEMDAERRDKIAAQLMELDAELWALDEKRPA